jgi:hypothetical protein
MDFCKYQVGISNGNEGCDNIQVRYFKPIDILFIEPRLNLDIYTMFVWTTAEQGLVAHLLH